MRIRVDASEQDVMEILRTTFSAVDLATLHVTREGSLFAIVPRRAEPASTLALRFRGELGHDL
jgi:hypothetical protein